MDSPFANELRLGTLAVQRASVFTKSVLVAVKKGEMDNVEMARGDGTQVTLADFGAQVLLISALHRNFPEDSYVGQESAMELRNDAAFVDRLWKLVSSEWLEDEGSERLLGAPSSKEEMLDILDLGGKGHGGRAGRVWILDPLDGTATFLSGEQYAVSLALVEHGQQKIGILGCPNFIVINGQVDEKLVDEVGYGLMLSAVKGHGACIQSITRGALNLPQRLATVEWATESRDIHWVEAMSAYSCQRYRHHQVAVMLGASWPGTDLWSGQVKYAALAVGACDVWIRIPRKQDRREYVWDHAGGELILQEVGGKITDIDGKSFDFGEGRKLQGNFGLVAAPTNLHNRVLDAVKQVLENQ